MASSREGHLTRMPEFTSDGINPPAPTEDLWALAMDVQETETGELNPPYDPSDSPTYGQSDEELL